MTKKATTDPFGMGIVLMAVGDMRQRHLEEWAAAYREAGDPKGRIEVDSANVRAAIVAGWIVEPSDWKPSDVPDMRPAVVRWLSEQTSRIYEEATTVPKG